MARPTRPRRSIGPILPLSLVLVVGSAAGAWYGGLLPQEWRASIQQLISGGRGKNLDPEKENVPPPQEVAAKELISIESDLAKLDQVEPPELVVPGEGGPALSQRGLPGELAPPSPGADQAGGVDLGTGRASDSFDEIQQARGEKGITKTVFEQEELPEEDAPVKRTARRPRTEPSDEEPPVAPKKKPGKKSAAGRSGAANVPHVPVSASVASEETGLGGSAGLVDQGTIQGLIDKGDLSAAHRELSRWFWKEPARREELRPQLDDLAKQIYLDPTPHFEEPYVVRSGDLLQSIARKYKLSWEYLAKLNHTDPRKIRAGQKLKVVPGPFAALVSLSRHELIIHQNGAFVKSYRVGLGKANSTPAGKFVVKGKEKNPTYYGPDGVIAADDPQNPLGERWVDIGDSYGIHGTIDPDSIGKNESRGCVRLLNSDVEEVYDFLVVGSEVRIVR